MVRQLVMVAVLVAFGSYCWGGIGSAQAQEIPAQWHLTVTGGTEFPIDVAARLTLETPGRVLLSTSLGVMPMGYVDLLNSILVEGGAYPQSTADFIQSALQNSLTWKTHVGWRPLKNWGFFVSGGYTLATLGGTLTGAEIISAATGLEPPQEVERFDAEIRARSTLHLLGGEVGYQWIIFDRLVIQLTAGGFATVGASSYLSHHGLEGKIEGVKANKVIDSYLREGERFLDNIYTSYVHAGYLGFQAGFQFF